MRSKKDLTQGPIGPMLISLSSPMALGLFALMAFNLVDTYFVAQLGTRELAAISFTFAPIWAVMAVAMGLGIAVASGVSRAYGADDFNQVKRLTTDGLLLSALIVSASVAIGLGSMDFVFSQLGANAPMRELIKQYMSIWYWGMFFLVVPLVGNNAIRASGDTKLPALIMIGSALINLILDPLLIFGMFGFPRLGLRGAAIATVLARACSLVASLYILIVRKSVIDFSIPRLAAVLRSWKAILSIGIPTAATSLFVPAASAVVTRLAAACGVAAVAAIGAGLRIETFALLVILALCSALVPFSGQNWGAKNYGRVCHAHSLSSAFSLGWGFVCVVLLAIFSSFIAGLFSQDAEVISAIKLFLWIVPFSYGLRSLRIVSTSVFNAIGKPLHAARLNFFWILLLYIPCAFLGFRLGGFLGILIGITFAQSIAGIVAYAWLRSFCLRRV